MAVRECPHPDAVLETKVDGTLMLYCPECRSWSMRAPGAGPPLLGPTLVDEPDDDTLGGAG